MTFVDEARNFTIQWEDGDIIVLTLERPVAFSAFLRDIYRKNAGEESPVVLFKNNKEVKLSKQAEIISDPFSLEINSRKILGALYQELTEVGLEFYFSQAQKLNADCIDYLEAITSNVPYPVVYNLDLEQSGLFKLYDVKMEATADSILERLAAYIKILKTLCGTSLLFTVNLKSYLTEEELLLLYKEARYAGVALFLVESVQRSQLEGEKNVLLDGDDCVIIF